MKRSEINIRDPYVLVHGGKYYLYGTRGATCWGEADGFDCYVGTDLEEWEGPFEIFHNDGSFWADRNYWAPEVHVYEGAFYLFASFKKEGVCRGTQILKADSPLGPFIPHSDGPVTPKDWECLDGTLYVAEDGRPYMVFCHEWVQIKDGTICCVELSKDLKKAVKEPAVLFSASQAPWVRPAKDGDCFVTDGPYLYRTEDKTLLMIWSSFGKEGYTEAIARSDNGDILGNWHQDETLLFEKDGGHGMIFRGLDGALYLTLHSPNRSLEERPVFHKLKEKKGNLLIDSK